MQCRFIDTGYNDAFTNMSMEEAILRYCKYPTLRVYGWKPSAISIGYNQNIDEIKLAECNRNKIPVVRRLSGGTAIFHSSEVTYCFIVPESSKILPESITESYRIISSAIANGLKKIGIECAMERQPEKKKTPICFYSTNWYELTAGGKKAVGSAQRRMGGKILQHGSIMLDIDCEKNISLFNSELTVAELKSRIIGLNTHSKRKLEYNNIRDAILHGFADAFGFNMRMDRLSDDEIRLAENLKKEKYSTEKWNFKKSI